MASPSLGLPAGPLTPEDLARWPMLGLSEQSPHFPAIAQWFEAGGASYRPVVSCNSLSVIAEMAAAGLGVAMLHRTTYRHLLDSGKLQVLDTEPAAPRIGFVGVHRRNLQSPLVMALMGMAVALSEFSSAPAVAEIAQAQGERLRSPPSSPHPPPVTAR
jgi:DNA-binding transcriptional LysR family regulator